MKIFYSPVCYRIFPLFAHYNLSPLRYIPTPADRASILDYIALRQVAG